MGWYIHSFELIQYIVCLTVNMVTVGCLYTLEIVSISKSGFSEIVVVVKLPIKNCYCRYICCRLFTR